MAKLSKNTVFVYYYSENTGEASYYGGTRCVVCKSFEKAYAELECDVNYFIDKYHAEVLGQWINDPSLQNATCTSVALRMEDGNILDLHIAPSVAY